MFYNSNWFCYMTFLSAVRLLYTWIFQFLLEIGSWISWCYSFSGSFMKPVDNFLLWISFLDILWYVDIYLRWWTSMQLILNLMWNYDAPMFSVCFTIVTIFVFIFEQKLQLCYTCLHVNNILLYVLNYCVLFVLFCIVICFCKISIQLLNLKVCFYGNYFPKLRTVSVLLS